jgi:hypothetical protein
MKCCIVPGRIDMLERGFKQLPNVLSSILAPLSTTTSELSFPPVFCTCMTFQSQLRARRSLIQVLAPSMYICDQPRNPTRRS